MIPGNQRIHSQVYIYISANDGDQRFKRPSWNALGWKKLRHKPRSRRNVDNCSRGRGV